MNAGKHTRPAHQIYCLVDVRRSDDGELVNGEFGESMVLSPARRCTRSRMKATVERLSDELSARYLIYIESLMIDLWNENGEVEFRCGFALRSDHQLRTATFRVRAEDTLNDQERELIIGAVFRELETMIDRAIADRAFN